MDERASPAALSVSLNGQITSLRPIGEANIQDAVMLVLDCHARTAINFFYMTDVKWRQQYIVSQFPPSGEDIPAIITPMETGEFVKA